MDYGWVSNNSIYAELGMDYTEVQDSILKNGGEPGLCWLENMRAYGRMIEPPNYRD
jgi:ribonucleoside-triphosphate reductase